MSTVSLLSIVESCDKVPYNETEYFSQQKIARFLVNEVTIGYVDEVALLEMEKYIATVCERSFRVSKQFVTFHPEVKTFEARSEVIMDLLKYWKEKGVFSCLTGWRNEFYPVYGDSKQPGNIAFRVERAGASIFGFRTFGAHLNGYVRTETGLKMWIGRRSLKKPTWPGLLDNIVAGGVSYGQSPDETIVRECDEEANIPSDITVNIKAAGAITYFDLTERGLAPETQYVYDLELPQDFVPKPNDGEVDCFYLWDLAEVRQHIGAGEFKPNCALVIIDFMIRHGHITSSDEPDFLEILDRIHRRFELPGPKGC
ncbi:hypothetical protein K493DRAFT_410500 [Basidiobolus meristosporus CBS 931.73]|uniref:Nudix hydrolase domain-containing protein n=1 Tax=Basidiobolus meristosporus CBS 931.73 TaxID=1314790 RepID=A0A1Y1XU93_9FUNG|nr:hypothetical protein K493DRAFT_410500 [Basidiobolus meristosporus CBS 931.73]|eukprot:ORX89332.1 hypothetical protein K493DRAFT_410500 [Basidiobolus meristosporus CBS 931.73]